MAWMDNLAVQNEIVKVMRNREVMIHKIYQKDDGTEKRIIKRRN